MHMTTRFLMRFATLVPLALSRIAAPGYKVRKRALESQTTYGRFSAQGAHIPSDLIIVCLWSTVGLALTALLACLGFGDQIGQFLAAAG
jgi:hypothetical protein